MTTNDRIPNFNEPQRRNQRRGRGRLRKSPAQAQPASDTQSVCAETTSSAQFNSAMITGGQFTAATNANHRHVTININATEGTPQPQIQNNHPRQATNRGRNRRTGPMAVPPGPVQRSNEIYERHLRLKKRGHPLWIPQSNMVLPIPYRVQGVCVGDVGIFTENGGFDFLFNICLPRDDPINPRNLPENFVPISPPVDPTDIRKFAEFSPGSYLASSSVAESRTTESSGLIFESSASEGAILTMPEGAYSEDLSNSSRFKPYIATHAEDWYKFVNGPHGREAQNGDLHVVVGCDKTTSWGMATFANSSLSQETNFRLKFSVLGEQESQRNSGNKYMWEHSGVAEVRVGPGHRENEELGETNSNRLQNQSLFLRTLNVTLSEKVWEEILSLPLPVADQNPHSDSGIQDHAKCRPHVINTRRSHQQPSQSNSHQNLPNSRSHDSTNSPISSNLTLNDLVPPNLMSPFGNLYSHDVIDEVPCLSSDSEIEQNLDSGPSTDYFTDMFLQDVLESSLKMKYVTASQPSLKEGTSSQISNTSPSLGSYEEIQCNSPTPDVILTRSSSCNSVLHPSKIINQYLLKHVPHARVAVTHDKDWSSIIDVASCHSNPSQLFSVVCSRNDIVLDNDTGLVYLELKEKNENGVPSEEAKVAGIIESIKDGRLRLDQYLFGFHDDRRLRLQNLCNMLRSGSTNQPIPMDSFLSAHPERPLSLDELLNIFKRDVHVQGSIPRQSITSLRARLSLLPTRHGDRSGFLLRLGDALLRRFSEWAQKDDLEEAIWSYKEVLSLITKSHHYYLEALLGLCSSLYQRYYLLGHADDLKNLLLYLDLQCDIFHQPRSLLTPAEVQLGQNILKLSLSKKQANGPAPALLPLSAINTPDVVPLEQLNNCDRQSSLSPLLQCDGIPEVNDILMPFDNLSNQGVDQEDMEISTPSITYECDQMDNMGFNPADYSSYFSASPISISSEITRISDPSQNLWKPRNEIDLNNSPFSTFGLLQDGHNSSSTSSTYILSSPMSLTSSPHTSPAVGSPVGEQPSLNSLFFSPPYEPHASTAPRPKKATSVRKRSKATSPSRLSSSLSSLWNDILPYACGHDECWPTRKHCFATSGELVEHIEDQHPERDSTRKLFRCAQSGCDKSWKSINGLQYHLLISMSHFTSAMFSKNKLSAQQPNSLAQNTASSSTLVEEDLEPERKYACPHVGCLKAYRQSSGLRYHRKHGHHDPLAPNMLAQLPIVPPISGQQMSANIKKLRPKASPESTIV